MIRIVKPAEDIPEVLLEKGLTAGKELEDLYDSGTRAFPSEMFDSAIYGHKKVKEKLILLQHDKCCFCEAKITHISYGDVEHFRPKAGWVQLNEPLNQPGYYWLAYDWANLFLSCQLCNQRFKKNLFPLANPATRAVSHHQSIADEDPLFIHLTDEDPEAFIAFYEEVPFAIDGNKRAEQTIINTGIDRENLNSHRLSFLNKVRDIYELAKDCPPVPADIKVRALTKIKKYFDESQQDATEYASMLRCFFKANPIANL